MGRVISGTLSTILSAAERDKDYTLDLNFPDPGVAPALHYATSPIASLNGFTYTNDLNGIGEIRQTLESATNRVKVRIQNRDRVAGLHFSSLWTQWRKAEAVIGRIYYEINAATKQRTGTVAWLELFRGAVQQPQPDDKELGFDVVHDTLSPGQIVCNKSLGILCGWVFKDAKTCAYVGAETLCDHHLKSTGGCEGRANTHHFGGMEHRYEPVPNPPGTGGNLEDPPIFDPPGCPRLDQYVRVRGDDGRPLVKKVCFFTEDDWLWDPIERDFFPTESARVIRNVPIWEMVTASGAVCFSSYSHLVMPNEEHPAGLAAERITRADEVLTEDIAGELLPSFAASSQPSIAKGDVMHIKMKGGHHYACGDRPDRLIVGHNSKPPLFD